MTDFERELQHQLSGELDGITVKRSDLVQTAMVRGRAMKRRRRTAAFAASMAGVIAIAIAAPRIVSDNNSQPATPTIPEQSGTIRHIERIDSGTVWMVAEAPNSAPRVISIDSDGHRTTHTLPDSDQLSSLTSLDMSSDTYGWIAGSTQTRQTGYAAYWDGERWTRVEIPKYAPPKETDWSSPTISASSPQNVWLLNPYTHPSKVWHWDGAQWREQTVGGQPAIRQVVTTDENTTWFDGGDSNGTEFVRLDDSGTKTLDAGTSANILEMTEGADGGVFAVGELVASGNVNYMLQGITCTENECSTQTIMNDFVQIDAVDVATDGAAWAAGTFNGEDGNGPLALHQTESGWERVEMPDSCSGDGRPELEDVSVVADDEVYAVGRCEPEGGGTSRILALRYDGEEWTSMVKE